MSSAEPVDFFVDISELTRIAQDLTSLSAQLTDTRSTSALHIDAGTAGSKDVAEAVGRFLDRWKNAREELARKLEGARDQVRAAAEAYDATERGLTGALTPTDGGPRA